MKPTTRRKRVIDAAFEHYGKKCISLKEFHDFAFGKSQSARLIKEILNPLSKTSK